MGLGTRTHSHAAVVGHGEHAASRPAESGEDDHLALLLHLMRRRRSVRRYEQRPVPRPLLVELVDAATRAPSNFNSQPWRFVALDEPASRERIVEAVVEKMRETEGEGISTELFHVIDHITRWLYPLRDSPVLLLAFYKPNPSVVTQGLEQIPGAGQVLDYNPNLLSLGMALQNLLLACCAAGLGACALAGPVPFLRGSINAILRLPEELELAAVVSLGYPAESPSEPPHRRLSRVLSFVPPTEEAPEP
jgi:coenzyme F420-0:L-glutamate ligase / coenzyme F420-1:gamma-L-glutamate ligase